MKFFTKAFAADKFGKFGKFGEEREVNEFFLFFQNFPNFPNFLNSLSRVDQLRGFGERQGVEFELPPGFGLRIKFVDDARRAVI